MGLRDELCAPAASLLCHLLAPSPGAPRPPAPLCAPAAHLPPPPPREGGAGRAVAPRANRATRRPAAPATSVHYGAGGATGGACRAPACLPERIAAFKGRRE